MVAFSVITPRRRSSSVYCGRSFSGKRRRTSTKNSGTKDRQHGGGDHPAHHSGADRMLAAGTGAGAGRHRQHAEDERQRGHQDGAQALTASRQRGAEQIRPFSLSSLANSTIRMAFFADRPITVNRPTRKYTSFSRPRIGSPAGRQSPQRHHQHHRERHRPALVQRRRTGTPPAEKSHTGPAPERQRGVLVGHGGPFEAKAGG